MPIYVTNPPLPGEDQTGVVRTNDGKDYIIPIGVVDFVISISMTDVAYKTAHLIVGASPQYPDGVQPAGPAPDPTYPFQFKGYIQYSTDFPLKGQPVKGDTYRVTNNVIDNSTGRTNTGQSFSADDQIFWNGTGWLLDFSAVTAGGSASWQTPVVAIVTTPAGGETIGHRYLIDVGATGVFAGKDNNIAELTASGWVFTAPLTNMSVVVSSTDTAYTYDADTALWVQSAGPQILFTAGRGLAKATPTKLEVDLDPTGGLTFTGAGDTSQLKIDVVDGGTL